MKIDRHYYKCLCCLSVVAIEGNRQNVVCSVCDVKMEYMGQVEFDRLVTAEMEAACDDRCISAQGPKCVCRCHAENHGSGKVVEVHHDAGNIPRVTPNDGSAIKRRDEYITAHKSAKERLQIKYGANLEAFKTGAWISDKNLWLSIRMDMKQLGHASNLKVHKTRIAKLNAFLI